jgi:hydroxymethylbilane synthase
MNKIRVGTRESKLAIRQTEIIIETLKKHHPELEFEIVGIKTTGDKILDVTLSKIGGKGLFIKEIEDALLKDKIDIAVHSLKDMPAEIHEELTLAAYTEREDASDCLISANGMGLHSLPYGAIIGTSSLRRNCQIKAIRPDFEILPLRGNILTRLKKLDEGQYHAIVLASAGIKRLKISERITERLNINTFIPAVCQGIICVETKRDRQDIIELLKACDNTQSRIAALCERAFLKRIDGSCKIAVGAYCTITGDTLRVSGMVGDEEKSIVYTEALEGSIEEAESIGIKLADILREKKNK